VTVAVLAPATVGAEVSVTGADPSRLMAGTGPEQLHSGALVLRHPEVAASAPASATDRSPVVGAKISFVKVRTMPLPHYQ